MDALIMAAGRGSRLGRTTDERPKSLIDLGGVTALEWQLDLLLSHGVDRMVIVTGYRRDQIERTAHDRVRGNARLTFCWNPFWSVTNVLGSAWMARRASSPVWTPLTMRAPRHSLRIQPRSWPPHDRALQLRRERRVPQGPLARNHDIGEIHQAAVPEEPGQPARAHQESKNQAK